MNDNLGSNKPEQSLTRYEKAAMTKARNKSLKLTAAATAAGAEASSGAATTTGSGHGTTRSSKRQAEKMATEPANVNNDKPKPRPKKRQPPTPIKESRKVKVTKVAHAATDEMDIDFDLATHSGIGKHLAPVIEVNILDLSGGGRPQQGDDTASSASGSGEASSEGEESVQSESDDHLKSIARNPKALRDKFQCERAVWVSDGPDNTRRHGTMGPSTQDVHGRSLRRTYAVADLNSFIDPDKSEHIPSEATMMPVQCEIGALHSNVSLPDTSDGNNSDLNSEADTTLRPLYERQDNRPDSRASSVASLGLNQIELCDTATSQRADQHNGQRAANQHNGQRAANQHTGQRTGQHTGQRASQRTGQLHTGQYTDQRAGPHVADQHNGHAGQHASQRPDQHHASQRGTDQHNGQRASQRAGQRGADQHDGQRASQRTDQRDDGQRASQRADQRDTDQHDGQRASQNEQTIKPRQRSTSKTVTEKKQTVGRKSTREEKFRNEIATWNADRTRQVSEASQKTSRSSSSETKKESQTVIVKYEDNDSDALPTESTDLILVNGHINLKDQHPHVQAIMLQCITDIQADLVLNNAYPEKGNFETLGEYAGYMARDAAEELQYKAISDRLIQDHKYRDTFVKILKDRISHFRSLAKSSLEAAHPALNVERYMSDWDDVKTKKSYIFPDLPGRHLAPNTKRPYENERIITLLRIFFFRTPSSYGRKFEDFLPKFREQKAVTSAMVAFAAMALFICVKKAYFPETRLDLSTSLRDIYHSHLSLLHELKERYNNRYEDLVVTLYRRALNGSEIVEVETDGGMGLKDLIEFDED